MPRPDEALTPTQLSILQVIWNAGSAGATVASLWEALCEHRPVARTTVLTQVQRLEKRGWLVRDAADGVAVYRAARGREQAERTLARRFVADFFAGSAAGLIKSLLGSGRIGKRELAELKAIIDRAEQKR